MKRIRYKYIRWVGLCVLLGILVVACSIQTEEVTASKDEDFKVELSVDRSKGERWMWVNADQLSDIELKSISYVQKVTPSKQEGGLETFTFTAHEAGTYTLEFSQ